MINFTLDCSAEYTLRMSIFYFRNSLNQNYPNQQNQKKMRMTQRRRSQNLNLHQRYYDFTLCVSIRIYQSSKIVFLGPAYIKTTPDRDNECVGIYCWKQFYQILKLVIRSYQQDKGMVFHIWSWIYFYWLSMFVFYSLKIMYQVKSYIP